MHTCHIAPLDPLVNGPTTTIGIKVTVFVIPNDVWRTGLDFRDQTTLQVINEIHEIINARSNAKVSDL